MSWIDEQFPAATGRHRETSAADVAYNCIAFAAGTTDQWWSHAAGYRWPTTRSPSAGSLVAVFNTLGYQRCDGAVVEAGYERVVLYARDGRWTHASRQLPTGKWASKLGGEEDVEHDTPECLCGDLYGDVLCIMRRATP